MKLFLCILFLAVLTLAAQDNEEKEGDQVKSLAILPFTHHQEKFAQASAIIPDLLISELVNIPKIRLVERGRIEEAKEAIAIENNNFNAAETQLELGKWLGAEYMMMGGISQLGNNVRIDMRIIDVKSGTIQFATGVQGQEFNFYNLVTELAQKARIALSPKNPHTKNIASLPSGKNPFKDTELKAKVLFSLDLKLGLFTTRNFPIQKVRIYVDGKLQAESELINQFNRQWDLFEIEIPYGDHKIEIVHGVINRKGEWYKAIKEQPYEFYLNIDSQNQRRVVYEQTVLNHEVKYSQLR